MTEKEYNEKVENLVDNLQCSIAEAKEVLACDKKIDRNEEVDFGLSKAEEKQAIKLAHKGDKIKKQPTVYNFNKRERKVNQTKKDIVDYLYECFKDYDKVEITNAERQIKFSANGNDYELTLVQKRKPKK